MVNIWPKTGFEKLSQHLARTVFSTLNLSYSSDACSWCSEVPKLKLVKRRFVFHPESIDHISGHKIQEKR